jgi:hypothetical protein
MRLKSLKALLNIHFQQTKTPRFARDLQPLRNVVIHQSGIKLSENYMFFKQNPASLEAGSQQARGYLTLSYAS